MPQHQNPRTPRPNCAFFYAPDGYRTDLGNLNGRRSAGAGFLRGFIEHGGADRLVALTGSRRHFDDFRALADAFDREGRERVWARPLDRRALQSVGTVFVPGPGLDQEAWTRRLGSERDYSLCGVTYTLSQDRIVNALGHYLTAPTQPWDALVCISTAARAAVERLLEQHVDYLARRGGGRFRSPVRLVVIPLGVDCDFYAPRNDDAVSGAGPGARRGLRARLGIAQDDLAALFVGRLSFHAKAHPTPMYLAAARAAERVRGRTIHLLLAGQFPNRSVETEFRAAAARFCGAARVHFLDGADNALVRAAWRASDIFVSLSDNIQESLGLTPIEAMAAGLPCVVSDWNGYRDTVVDGETGFRIASTTAGPGAGIDIADRYAAGIDSYDRMIGITSLATAVDVDACAEAIARLASDGELRARQGAAAMARARRLYDWLGGGRRVPESVGRTGRAARDRRRCGAARQPGAGQGRFSRPVRDLPDLPHHPARPGHGGRREERRPGRATDAAARGHAAPLRRLCLPVGRRRGHPDGAAGVRADADRGPRRRQTNDWRKLVRTLLWLRKFDLVEFAGPAPRPGGQ